MSAALLELLDAWRDPSPPSIEQLGGERAVIEASEELVKSPHFGVVVASLCAGWPELNDRPSVLDVILNGIRRSGRLLQVQNALDAVLASGPVLQDSSGPLLDVLIERGSSRVTSADAAIAAACLGAALRLVVGGWSPDRLRVAVAITTFSDDVDELFGVPVARLLGTAYEHWRLAEFKASLARLKQVKGVTDDARHEMGMTLICDALDADDLGAMLAGLDQAATELDGSSREDSQMFAVAARAVSSLNTTGSMDWQVVQEDLHRRVQMYQLGTYRMHETWLTPRADAGVSWLRLVDAIASTVVEGDAAAVAAARLFEAYAASRSVRLVSYEARFGAIERIVEPAIEAALLNEVSLSASLTSLLNQIGEDDPARSHADALLALVVGSKKNGTNSSSSRFRA